MSMEGDRPARPIAAVLAITRRDDQVVLVRRANSPDRGLWGFPGGKIEHGETMLHAAERELLEETGIEGHGTTILRTLETIGPDDHHYILIAVLCCWSAHEPIAADDALEARWFDLQAIASLHDAVSQDVLEVATAALDARWSP